MITSYLGETAYKYALHTMNAHPSHYSLKLVDSQYHYGTDLVIRFFFRSGKHVDYLTGVSQIASDIRTVQPRNVVRTKQELIQYFAAIGINSLAAAKPTCKVNLEQNDSESPYNQLGMT